MNGDQDPIITEPEPAPGQGHPVSGWLEETDDSGRAVLRAQTLDGVLHGTLQRWNAEQDIQTLQCHFENGLLHGPMQVRTEAGELAQECEYRQGQLHGLLKVYVHGRCVSEQTYVDGVLAGLTVTYDEAGHVSARLTYAQGQLDGPAQFFHEGREVRRASYRMGRLEGPSIDYSVDGQVTQSAHFQDNLLHGPLVRYWPNGEVMEERTYEKGRPVEPEGLPTNRGRSSSAATAPADWSHRLQRWVRGD